MIHKTTLLALVMLIFSLQSCKNKAQKPEKQLTEENSILVQDKFGEIRVPKSPKRIVVLTLAGLDDLEALGLSKNVVGFPKQLVPDYLKDLQENDSITDAGSLTEPNFRIVNDLNPDLIIIGPRQRKSRAELSKIAPTIYYDLDYTNFLGSVKKNVMRLGKIYNQEDKAKTLISNTFNKVDKHKNTDSTLTGLVVLHNNGKFSAYGGGSRFGFIHDNFDITPVSHNLKASTHGNSISSEYIQEHNPDILFVIDRNAAIGRGHMDRSTVENALIKETSAYKNGKIIYLTPKVWYLAGGGIQALQIMTKEVGQAFTK